MFLHMGLYTLTDRFAHSCRWVGMFLQMCLYTVASTLGNKHDLIGMCIQSRDQPDLTILLVEVCSIVQQQSEYI